MALTLKNKITRIELERLDKPLDYNNNKKNKKTKQEANVMLVNQSTV